MEDSADVQPAGGGSFCFNRREGTVLGRTGGSWAKITLFYIIYYGCLAGWFAGLLNVFYVTLDEEAPKYYGNDSLHRNNPGLGMRPVPIVDLTLIRFSGGIPSSYQPYTQHLKAFIKTYDDPEQAVDCATDANETRACLFDAAAALEAAGCLETEDYGYAMGTPCVIIKMNKLYNFTAEPYASYDEIVNDVKSSAGNSDRKYNIYKNSVAPPEDKMSFAPGKVGISCEGSNAIDKMHVKSIKFAPTDGLDLKYFPYLNQPGYRSPFVAFKFEVEKRQLVQIVCRIWARNVDNSDGQPKRGSIHFEVLRN
jgi:sodium/potassium-transporting ATPase subunit beta